jgi:acyl dehydratase
MALDPGAVGTVGDLVSVSWTSTDALLYAVTLNFGAGDLEYVTENSIGVAQRVVPTFPVVVGGRAGSALDKIGTYDPAMLVHGRQAVTLHKPVPVEATVTLQQKVVAMHDKGSAAVVVLETTATDEVDGRPMYTVIASLFIRGEGGWGGERGPSGPQNAPPDRTPDHQITYQTSPDQALIYRLNGDRNPLHSDPSFAALGGFDRPILHGLCTFGFTGRGLLATLCDGDSMRFRHIEGRFVSPVVPGEALVVSAWKVAEGEAVFSTSVDGRVVIDQGRLLFWERTDEINSPAWPTQER